MTAIEVYGVRVGEVFRNEEGDILTVLGFITPATLVEPWRARVTNGKDEGEMEVKDLLSMQEVLG